MAAGLLYARAQQLGGQRYSLKNSPDFNFAQQMKIKEQISYETMKKGLSSHAANESFAMQPMNVVPAG